MNSGWNSLWPWLAVAAAGALHGLNPGSGWMFAAAWGVRSQDLRQALYAMIPIAIGHAASIGLVGAALVFGLRMDRIALQLMAGVLIVIVGALHLLGRLPAAARRPAGHAGLALWSFMMATVHGAGLMLLPSLISLCTVSTPAGDVTASDSLLPTVAAIGLHTLAMIAVSGVVATGVCRALDARAWLQLGGKLKQRAAL